MVVQRYWKRRVLTRRFMNVRGASIAIQSGIRGWLARRCSGDVNLLYSTINIEGAKGDHVIVKSSVLAQLQRRILKAEAGLRDKEKENDLIHQRLHRYETRWLEYEQKIRSMEEVWQKQMRSLQSSLSIAKKSLAMDDAAGRVSDGSVDQSWDSTGGGGHTTRSGGGIREENGTTRPMSAGLSVIGHLAEEFEQRSQVFADDTKFLVEVKYGQSESSLNPERELRWLKQTFDSWKDYTVRLREAKVIINKLASDEASAVTADKANKKKWWGRLNSSKVV